MPRHRQCVCSLKSPTGAGMSKPAFVYVIGCADGPYKVGYSASPGNRLFALGLGSRPGYAVLHTVECSRARDVEQMAHHLLQEDRIKGEWFTASLEKCREAIDRAHELVQQGHSIPPSERLELHVTLAFLRRIDDWRRAQPDLPSRSEAIRRIVDVYLNRNTIPADAKCTTYGVTRIDTASFLTSRTESGGDEKK